MQTMQAAPLFICTPYIIIKTTYRAWLTDVRSEAGEKKFKGQEMDENENEREEGVRQKCIAQMQMPHSELDNSHKG
jgi:hypothetical protein